MKYKLEDLVKECDLSKEISKDLKEWESMPDTGKEKILDKKFDKE